MITRLHHVQISIPKGTEDEARHFYCELLGLAEIDKPESLQRRGGLWLQLGDQQLHIGTEDDVDRRVTKAHVAYQVSNLEEWREKLSAAGVQVDVSVPIPGFRRFEFRDPFGNRIELIEPE